MIMRNNPVKHMMLVRKIDGKLVVEVEGTVRVPIKLKPLSVPLPKTPTIFPFCSVEMRFPDSSSL
jgi:hypothetical protein